MVDIVNKPFNKLVCVNDEIIAKFSDLEDAEICLWALQDFYSMNDNVELLDLSDLSEEC